MLVNSEHDMASLSKYEIKYIWVVFIFNKWPIICDDYDNLINNATAEIIDLCSGINAWIDNANLNDRTYLKNKVALLSCSYSNLA